MVYSMKSSYKHEIFALLGYYTALNSSVVTGVLGQPVRSIFKGPAVSVTNYHSSLCYIPEDRRTHLHCGRRLKPGIQILFSDI